MTSVLDEQLYICLTWPFICILDYCQISPKRNKSTLCVLSFEKVKVGLPVFMPQDSRSLAGTEDKETFLVTLTKPCLYVQQVAFDKGEYMAT